MERLAFRFDLVECCCHLYSSYYSDDDNSDPRELLARPAWNETLSVLIDMRLESCRFANVAGYDVKRPLSADRDGAKK
jgi:hypothetical protein